MSFIHSLFLLGALAAAVPVLIHMSKSRNYRRVRIGTLRFLSSVVQERRRLRTIENWPLLLARIGILILLAMIFARPFWPDAEPALPKGAETIVLVDSSGSLAHPKAASRIDDLLKKIEKDLPPESTLTIAEFADVVQVTNDPQAVPGAPTNYAAAVDWTVEHLANSEHTPAAIHIITDLQQSPLPTTPPRLWPTGVKTEIHAVPQPADYNIAIESVTLSSPFKEEFVQIEALVKVFGSPPSGDRMPSELMFTLNNGTRKRADFPHQGGRVRFRWEPGESTEFAGTVSLASKDPWPSDNARSFSFRLQERKKILLLDGDPGTTPFLGEAYFLNKALLASGATHGQSPFTTTIGFGLTTRDGVIALHDYDAVALCNVASLSPAEAAALQQANTQGTSLMFILGDQTGNDTFLALESRGLFPKLKTAANSRMAPTTYWDDTQAVLAALPTAGLRAMLLRNAFSITTSPDWKTLAAFSNRNPLLLDRTNLIDGQAPVLVLAHPVTREWGDLPLANLFVPMMRELFSYLAGYENANSQVTPGTPGLQQRTPPGVYPTEDGKPALINADVAEMNPAIATVQVLRKSLGIPENVPPAETAPNEALPEMAEQTRELWPWLLLSLLALLAVENTLADRRLLTLKES